MPRKGPRILYPSYFDSRLSRSEGRRVNRSLALRKPTLQNLVDALEHLPLEYEIEDKHRPSRWYRFEGRVRVVYEGSKEELLRKVAEAMRRSRK